MLLPIHGIARANCLFDQHSFYQYILVVVFEFIPEFVFVGADFGFTQICIMIIIY